MAQLRSTLDVTLWDESNAYAASVTSAGEITTASRIWDGTNYVTVTGNKLDVNATMSWVNTNKVIPWDGTNNQPAGDVAARASFVKLTDGTNTVAVDASGRLTVIQPTASLLNATIGNGTGAAAVNIQDGGNSITVDQPTGSNLHTVLDSGTLTTITNAVTVAQATAANLNATIASNGPVTPGTVAAKSDLMGGQFNTALPTLTTGQQAAIQVDSNGRLLVNISGSSATNLIQTLWQQRVAAGQAFTITGSATIASGASENAWFWINNPVASGKTIRVKFIYVGIYTGSADADLVKIYRDPTITANGTALSVQPRVKGQAASSIALAYTGPTASANGTLLKQVCYNQSGGERYDPDLTFYINQGEKILFTVASTVNNKPHIFNVEWEEE